MIATGNLGRCATGLQPILEHAAYKMEVPATELPQPIPSPCSSHSTASRVVKGEDVLYIHPLSIATQPSSMLYMVCDGHSGAEAANYVAANFVRLLNSFLPAKAPNMSGPKEVEAFAEVVRQAVCDTFVRLDNDWIAVGHMSGTTVTAVIVVGYLLTVANIGDSSAVLDTGCSILELTASHRIQGNPEEQSRLRGAGCTLAPLGFHLQGPARQGELGVGPLRLWPGGLCVSRSVGDLDAGPEVVPLPHLRQLVIPQEGARMIVCSDGVWDLMSLSKAVKTCRFKQPNAATNALMASVTRDLRLMDDASIIVVDFLPSESTSFPTVALKANPKSERSSGGLFACFRPELDEPDSRDLHTTSPGHLRFLADVDSLRIYPQLRGLLQRSQIQHLATALSATAGGHGGKATDYTMHGANKVTLYRGFQDSGNASMGRTHSSSLPPVEYPSSDPNHSNHSAHSCEQPAAHKNGLFAGHSDYESPVVAFGSAPERQGSGLTT